MTPCLPKVAGGVSNIANTPHSVVLDSTQLEEASNNSAIDKVESLLRINIRIKQDGDVSLKSVKDWVLRSHVNRNIELQISPPLTLQLYYQLSSPCTSDEVFCCKFDPTDGYVSCLQQRVPQRLVEQRLGSIYSSPHWNTLRRRS